MSKRNIYFYSLKIIKTIVVNGTPLKEELSKDEVYEYMKELYDELPTNTNGLKYLKHNIVNNEYFLIEFLDFDQNNAFVRLGKPTPNNEVGKRNIESCDLKDIPLENAELIEAYTYLFIDFKTDVISFVRLGSAPSIKWFAIPLNSYRLESGFVIKCVPFTTDEILDSFSSNAEIGNISITAVKPTTQLSMMLGGFTEKDVEDLDSSEMSVSFSIKPKKRGGNTTNVKDVISRLFNSTKENEEDLRKFAVNIADEMDEKKTLIDLMKYRFIRTSDILSTSKLTPEQYKEEIVKVYNRELMTIKKLFKI